MAISLISSPDAYRPVFNDIQFVFDSTNTAQCDFQYVADLYVNGAFAVRLKAFADPDDEYGYFRIERVLQDYLSHDPQIGLVGFAQDPNSICSYYMEIRERYNTNSPCTGASTLSSVLHTTSTFYAYNAALSYIERPVYIETSYRVGTVNSTFLTNSPSRIRIPSDGTFNLYFLQKSGTACHDILIRTYNRFDTLLKQCVINNTYNLSSPSLPEDFHISVGVGPDQLNSSTLASGTQPVYHADVHYYTVVLRNSGGTHISEIKTFEIDSRCSKYEPYKLKWWNRLGGFDTYHFPLKFSRNVNINRTVFKKFLQSGYTVKTRGETVLSVNANASFVFNSDWVTEDEGIWLEELFTSPEVYLETADNTVTTSIASVTVIGGYVAFSLGIEIPVGATFSYDIDNAAAAALGISRSGTGTVTSYNGSVHISNIVAGISASSSVTGGVFIATYPASLPIVIASTSFEEKLSTSVKFIRYTIEAKPAYSVNVQSQ